VTVWLTKVRHESRPVFTNPIQLDVKSPIQNLGMSKKRQPHQMYEQATMNEAAGAADTALTCSRERRWLR
jgi:hypothetical protein